MKPIDVKCPSCGAKPGQPCKSMTGKPIAPGNDGCHHNRRPSS
jgi:hypothetical protein